METDASAASQSPSWSPEVGPLRVTSSPDCGRFYVAARDIGPGEVLLMEEPEALVIRESQVQQVCRACLLSGQRMPVSCLCAYAWYCSEACRAADRLHPSECVCLQRYCHPESRCSDSRTFVRLLIQLLCQRQQRKHRALDLHDGLDAFKQMKDWNDRRGRYRKLIQSFSETVSDGLTWRHDQLEAMLGMIECNRFDLWSKHRKHRLGMALYTLGSIFNHSCAPNVARVQRGAAAEFRAIAEVSEGDALTLAYVDPRLDKSARGRELRARYGFTCACCACSGGGSPSVDLCPRHLGYMIPRLGPDSPAAWCSVCGAPS
mmetsp:Transcript_40583/g.126330  ORF Transcript_40583/g.126330 Transcript_40583/m.126330 type:complete len:318 (+) Transcript_40583:116-1069(+)